MASTGEGAGALTLSAVVKDALAALAAGWVAHAASLVVLLALLFLSCCGVMCAMVPLAMLLGNDAPEGAPASPVLVGAIYVALALVGALLFAFYESITLHLTHAHGRGERPSYRAAVDASLRRMPAVLGTVVLRGMIDVIPPGLCACVIGAVMAIATPGDETDAFLAVAITLAYFASLVWWIGARGFVGLGLSCVTRDGLGPREGMERSVSLLHGRRWHFVAFRLVCLMFSFTVYCGSCVPFFVAAGIAPDALEGLPDETVGAMVIPWLFFGYVLVLALHAFDTILVAAYHGRVSPPVDADAIARVFS